MDEPEVSSESLSIPDSKPLEEKREEIRGLLAAALVGLVVVQVLVALTAVIAGSHAAAIEGLLDKTLPPSIALAGPSVGFYFAGRNDGP